MARDLQPRAVRGDDRHHDAGATAAGSTDRLHLAGALEDTRHEVAAGEAARGGHAEETVALKRVRLVECAVEIGVAAEGLVHVGAGQRVLHAGARLAQKQREHEAGRRGVAAAVAAQVEHHVLHGAALARDLSERIEADAHGVFGLGRGGILVIVHALRQRVEGVEGDVGDVADLLVAQDAVGVELCPRRLVARIGQVPVDNVLAKGRLYPRVFADPTGLAVERAVAIGEIDIHQVA